jgi:hypothetical protein
VETIAEGANLAIEAVDDIYDANARDVLLDGIDVTG